MKKLFFVLFLFTGLTVQSFASTAIEKMDIVNAGKENVEILLSADLVLAMEEENTTEDGYEFFDCWIVDVSCDDCGAQFEAQYCDEGHHGDYVSYLIDLCVDACAIP